MPISLVRSANWPEPPILAELHVYCSVVSARSRFERHGRWAFDVQSARITMLRYGKMEQLKQRIRLSHEAGRMPSTSKNGNFTLKLGDRKYSILVLNGKATKAGKAYESVTGQTLPSKYAADAKVERRARTDYITLASGKEAKLRTFDPVRNKYRLTPIGRSYYSQRKKSI